jgi:hypothetical protein
MQTCKASIQKLQLISEEHDKLDAEKVRDNIEELQSPIISLEESVSLTISKLRDEEFHPQVIQLSAGQAPICLS